MKLLTAPMVNYRITSPYGRRETGIVGASRDHKGIDMVATDKNLYLCAPGVLSSAGWNDFRGWFCEFDLGEGFSIFYQHMKYSCSLKVGEQYEHGAIVGIMGATRSTDKIPSMGDHLHFEVRHKGVPVDPAKYLQNIERRKMIEDKKVVCNGSVKTVKVVNIDDENYIRLRDTSEVLDLLQIGYDKIKDLPIINSKK